MDLSPSLLEHHPLRVAAKAYSLSSVLMLILMHARVLNEEPLVLRGAEIAATGKLADPQSLLCYDGNNSPGRNLSQWLIKKKFFVVISVFICCPVKRQVSSSPSWRDAGCLITENKEWDLCVCFPRVSAVLHPPGFQQQSGPSGCGKQHHAAAFPGNVRKRAQNVSAAGVNVSSSALNRKIRIF